MGKPVPNTSPSQASRAESPNDWPIRRAWSCYAKGDVQSTRSTAELGELPVVCLLGSAGLGKTHEMNRLVAAEQKAGRDTKSKRLALLASDVGGLAGGLERFGQTLTAESTVYLDALDEAMVPARHAALQLSNWIEGPLSHLKPRIRISCRSAVWPKEIVDALAELYGAEQVTVAILEPLDDGAIREAVTSSGLDAQAFMASVAAANGTSLAEHPLTLTMMMKVFRERGRLPQHRNELFAQGTRILAAERDERRRVGTSTTIGPDELLRVGERVACYTLLSGLEQVDMGDAPTPGSLGWMDLISPASSGLEVGETHLKTLGASGLCEGDGQHRFHFGHRQYAEYLAGRTLARLPLHQAKSMLSSKIGPKGGIAGPLRECAAFAANENADIATWLSDCDPEVIGLSEVASNRIRQAATTALFEKFRRHELTDAQVGRNAFELRGLRYDNAEKDVRDALRERQPGCDDVLEFAIELAEAWELQSVSDELADLVLDDKAPEHPRIAAGYAVYKVGTVAAKRRLKSLLTDGHIDPDWQLKGLALRCNWPDAFTTSELLDVLNQRSRNSFTGAYEGFLMALDHDGFKAEGELMKGLEWAASRVGVRQDYEPAVRIALRIIHSALDHLDDPAVLSFVAQLIVTGSRSHRDSPFRALRSPALRDAGQDSVPPLKGRTETRRRLLDAIVSIANKDEHLWWMAGQTPHLLESEDFPWLMTRVLDGQLPLEARHHYAELARSVFQMDDPASIELWLAVREQKPVRSVMNFPLEMELESKEAREAKRIHLRMLRMSRPRTPKPIKPPPKQRVLEVLTLCDTKDIQYFRAVCRELTLKDDSTEYGFTRFLTKTPGWAEADAPTQKRIVAAAKRFLIEDTKSLSEAANAPLNTILTTPMAAVWLVLDQDREWLAGKDAEWWKTWCWLFLRDLHASMSGESDDLKRSLYQIMVEAVPTEIHKHLTTLAREPVAESYELLRSTLRLIEPVPDAILDQQFSELIRKGDVATDRLGEVASFALRRVVSANGVCTSRFDAMADEPVNDTRHPVVMLAVSLLIDGDLESWDHVIDALAKRKDLCTQVLAAYAHSERLRRHQKDEEKSGPLDSTRIGKLVRLLYWTYPPDSDPQYNGAHAVGPNDSARDWRQQLLNRLSEGHDEDAVAALRSLEHDLGGKYSWLRRPRARAERAYRLSQWSPFPPKSIASVLEHAENRVIRSSDDAIDGILEAINLYAWKLKHEFPSPLEDLWNTAANVAPSPKVEERASDKLCEAIRLYFVNRAVTVDREVQVRRRVVPKDSEGKPGSEVDLVVQVPAVGAASGAPLIMPVEVKLSGNRQVKSALEDQLADRYISECGGNGGVFVVMWMTAPDMGNTDPPRWQSISKAREQLAIQAMAVSTAMGIRVEAVVVDCSLE